MDNNVGLGYGTMRYSRGALRFNFFTNILERRRVGAASAIGTDGQPIPFDFHTERPTTSSSATSTRSARRQVISYGGNFRFNNFDLSIAPLGTNRKEAGVYIAGRDLPARQAAPERRCAPRQVRRHRRPGVLAARGADHQADPRSRHPPVVQQGVPLAVAHQQLPRRRASSIRSISRRSIRRLPRFRGGGSTSRCTRSATPASWKSRFRPSRSAIPATSATGRRCRPPSTSRRTKTRSSSPRWAAIARSNPPPGWLQALPILPPAQALGILEVLPPPCPSPTAPCTTGGLPSEFSYRNLGVNRNKGFELGVDAAATQARERVRELLIPGDAGP